MYKSSKQKVTRRSSKKNPLESESGCPESESPTLESESKSESLKNWTRVGLESESRVRVLQVWSMRLYASATDMHMCSVCMMPVCCASVMTA
jgi:hypothetical protein